MNLIPNDLCLDSCFEVSCVHLATWKCKHPGNWNWLKFPWKLLLLSLEDIVILQNESRLYYCRHITEA